MRYSIYSSSTGQHVGIYAATSEDGALVALLADKADNAQYCREFRADQWRIRPLLSRTGAKQTAHRESHMYRQGRGWIVSTWDECVQCHRLSHELPFFEARQQLAEWRQQRAAYLCGEDN